MVNSNDDNIFISIDKLSETCYPIIEEAINNKISIESYIKQFTKLKKLIYHPEESDIELESVVNPRPRFRPTSIEPESSDVETELNVKPRPKPKHKSKSKLKLIYEEEPETYLTSDYEGSLTKKSSEVGKPISSFVNEPSDLLSEKLSSLSLSEKPSSSSSSISNLSLKPSSLSLKPSSSSTSLTLKPSSSSSSSSSLSENPLSNLTIEIESETGVNPIIEIQSERGEEPIGQLISKKIPKSKVKKFIIKEDSD